MLTSLLDPVVDLVLPRRCAGCGDAGSALCVPCRLSDPRATTLAGLPAAAATVYAGPTRRALLAYKERGRRDLAGPLGSLLADALAAVLAAAGLRPCEAVLVCVPSSRAAAARRGGDHVARLAVHAARATGVRRAPNVLRLRGGVRDSAGLTALDRARNLSHAMTAVPAPRLRTTGVSRSPTASGVARCARQVIVVDDIVTSGSTLREAYRALAAAGWLPAGAAAVAATPLTAGGDGVAWVPVAERRVTGHPLAVPR